METQRKWRDIFGSVVLMECYLDDDERFNLVNTLQVDPRIDDDLAAALMVSLPILDGKWKPLDLVKYHFPEAISKKIDRFSTNGEELRTILLSLGYKEEI